MIYIVYYMCMCMCMAFHGLTEGKEEEEVEKKEEEVDGGWRSARSRVLRVCIVHNPYSAYMHTYYDVMIDSQSMVASTCLIASCPSSHPLP